MFVLPKDSGLPPDTLQSLTKIIEEQGANEQTMNLIYKYLSNAHVKKFVAAYHKWGTVRQQSVQLKEAAPAGAQASIEKFLDTIAEDLQYIICTYMSLYVLYHVYISSMWAQCGPLPWAQYGGIRVTMPMRCT